TTRNIHRCQFIAEMLPDTLALLARRSFLDDAHPAVVLRMGKQRRPCEACRSPATIITATAIPTATAACGLRGVLGDLPERARPVDCARAGAAMRDDVFRGRLVALSPALGR